MTRGFSTDVVRELSSAGTKSLPEEQERELSAVIGEMGNVYATSKARNFVEENIFLLCTNHDFGLVLVRFAWIGPSAVEERWKTTKRVSVFLALRK